MTLTARVGPLSPLAFGRRPALAHHSAFAITAILLLLLFSLL